METYNQLKARHQQEFGLLPIKAAYNEEQFNRMLDEWGISRTDKSEWDNIRHIGGGGYIQVKDLDELHKTIERFDKESAEFLADDNNLFEAIKYELWNHEAIYGMGNFPDDIFDEIDLPDLRRSDPLVLDIYKKAEIEYLKEVERVF